MCIRDSSVFIVLWNPDQDEAVPDVSSSGYQDTWRPLVYWLDLILNSCRSPEIIVVCSHRSDRDQGLENRFKEQVEKSSHASRLLQKMPKLFFADSLSGQGELNGIRTELQLAVGRVVDRFGYAVPSYWEIAQDMVKGWLKQDEPPEAIDPTTFQDELLARIDASDPEKYQRLKQVCKEGKFALDEQDRIRRTLNFLTRSGWIYWNRNLFKGLIIICLLYTSPSPRDRQKSRMPSSA